MPLSDHYKGGMTERLLVSIITVDPSTRRVEAVGKDAAVIQVSVGPQFPAMFRWPAQGELWTIVRENGSWQLESRVPGPDDTPLASLSPGDGLVQSETIWTPSGAKLLRDTDIEGLTTDVSALQSESSAADTRLDTLEGRTQTFTFSAVSSISLGAFDGENITGVRITGHVITSGGVNTTIRVRPNGLTGISVLALTHAVIWNTAVTSTDTAANAGNLVNANGMMIAGSGWTTNSNGVWFGGELHTRKAQLGRKYIGQYGNHDYVTNVQQHSLATVTSFWNDLSTNITSLTLAIDAGTFTGRVSVEVIP